MCKIFTRLASILLVILLSGSMVFAQTTISGTVTDQATKESLAGVAITVKGKSIGTSTNENGRFSFTTSEKTPFTIVVSYLGYKSVEQLVTGSASNLAISLESQSILGQEVVVAASRTPERILESPVSIERVGAQAVRESAAPSFYDGLTNLKGVETSAQSLTFRSINTRGFNANGNVRFNQYVDGMDNQAPGLNFAVGNIVGISDLDVESAELLPGASSALYGAGGTNGTLILTSKSPFTYPGLSMSFKQGLNHVDDYQRNQTGFEDMSFRYAKSWNNKFAFKVNVSYLQAKDWEGQDYSNFNRAANTAKAGDRASDPRYDGVNVYGDEPNAAYPTLSNVAQQVQAQTRAGILAATSNTVDIVAALNAFLPANASAAQIGAFVGSLPAQLRPTVTNLIPFYFGLRNNVLPNQSVTRTGYAEKDLVDYNTQSFKTLSSVHYKFNDKVEAVLQANWGAGTSVYTGSDRYSLRNFNLGQYKAEIKGSDFFLRAYTTQERSGEAYNATLLGTYINEYTNPSTPSAAGPGWFAEYTAVYSQARLSGATEDQANVAARQYADRNRALPGTQRFEAVKKDVASRTIGPAGGAKFNDKTNMNHFEGMYNLSNAFNNVVEFQVGSSYRRYDLRSDGTIFDDLGKKLTIDEYGGFAQLGKKLLNDKLKLTTAVRYDKNENFEGRFTPRISGVFTVAPNNNIRASYQSGFRNPTTQNQYIDLLVGGSSGTRLIGGLPSLLDKYNLKSNPGYTLASVRAGAPEKYAFERDFRPESVNAYEVGYKGLLGSNLLLDAYYYFNTYKDFISSIIILQTENGQLPSASNPAKTFSTTVNNPEEVKSQGAALGLDYVYGKFNLSGNVSYNKLQENNSALESEFNTPEYRFNIGLSNREVIKNVGFNAVYRWQDKFMWSSTFAAGEVPAFGTVDAQVSVKIPTYKSTLKVGGSNLLNKYYRTSFGNPQIGGMYYVSILFDQFMR
ncbi:TonB-dependent receptor [Daejeonella oryzae]|uniref:TonB-dependent receptor n=1 Tax=Daejeonella oryzae TaxID=1122943 RepID=UPI00041C1BEC|nr:TonB-dependent receptor [Daejeonella oryzae]